MAKKKDWSEIDSWGSQRLLNRIKVLSREIEGVYAADIVATIHTSERLAEKADEVVYILLTLLKSVIKEKGWDDITPMQLFSGVYQQCTGYVWAPVHARFCEAQQLVDQFKNADKEERSLLRPKLASRGFI